MPVFTIDVGDIVESRIFCYFPARTQVAINVTHYRVLAVTGGGPKLFDGDTLAQNYSGAVNPSYQAALGLTCYFLGVEVQVIDPILTATGSSGIGVAAGDKDAQVLPAQVCGMVQFRTNEPGRSKRGRIYVPFPTEADNEVDGNPSAAYVVQLQAIAEAIHEKTAWDDGTEDFTAEQVIWSRVLASAEAVTEFQGKGKWGTQRRRGMYGSMNDIPDWVPLPLP